MPAPLALFLLVVFSTPMPPPAMGVGVCSAPDARVRIDHVVVAVGDLDAAANEFRRLGFTLKPGRLHSNGLLNAHFKFVDGTEIEMMSVVGEATDDIARDYGGLVDSGGGGAFLSLGAPQQVVAAAADDVGVRALLTAASPFLYVIFPSRGMRAAFAVEYERTFAEDPDYLHHGNGVTGVEEVWVEAEAELGDLLTQLGAKDCGEVTGPLGEMGTVYSVRGGRVVLVAPPTDRRPRVLGVGVRSSAIGDQLVRPEHGNGFWIAFRSNA